MTLLKDKEILKCVLGGKVGWEGHRRHGDGRRYEFHIIIHGADAHRMTAHMIALNEKRDAAKAQAIEDAKPKPKTYESNFTSKYATA